MDKHKTASKNGKKKGRPMGSKRPGSRPDLKTKHIPLDANSPEVQPATIALDVPGDMSIRSAVMQIKKEQFLKAFAVQGTKLHAAQAAGVARPTVDSWLKNDPEFRAAFGAAMEDSVDMLEHAGRVRAVAGVTRTVYYQDKPIGTRTEFSDTMNIFLLKGRRPEVFRERYELGGLGGGPVEISNPVQRIQAKLLEMKTRSMGLLPGEPEGKKGGDGGR